MENTLQTPLWNPKQKFKKIESLFTCDLVCSQTYSSFPSFFNYYTWGVAQPRPRDQVMSWILKRLVLELSGVVKGMR